MRVEDLQSKGTGWLIRLHEKGGKQHMMPCHHALAEALPLKLFDCKLACPRAAIRSSVRWPPYTGPRAA
jgi:hypothetical protein